MSLNSKLNYHPVREITTLKEMLASSETLYKDRPAFLVKKEKGGPYETINYNLLKRDVDALGTKLIQMGLKGEKIAVIGENCYEWIASYLAVVNGTGVVVPLDKELSKEEIYNLLDIAGCKAVFYSESFDKYFGEGGYQIPYRIKMKMYGDRTDVGETLPEATDSTYCTWAELVGSGERLLADGDRSFMDAEIDPEAMNMLLFTSGTTGKAKGVMLSHKNVMSCIMDTCRIAYILPEDRTLSILPIHHTFECTLGMLLVLYRGASAAFFEGLKYVNKNMIEAQPSVLIGVPLILENMYNKIWKQAEKSGKAGILRTAIRANRVLSAAGFNIKKKIFNEVYKNFGGKMRLFITGAAAIDPKVCRGLEDFGFKVMQGYGLTECSPLVAGPLDTENTYKKAGSVGQSVASGEIKIIDQDENGIGEIIFRGPNVMLGYYNQPEETAEVLKDGWYYTGDLGFVDKEGWLYIAGRKKNVIVTKTGKNIYPEEIEDHINRIKYVKDCLVYGQDEGTDDTIVSVQILPDYDEIYSEFGEGYDADQIYFLLKESIWKVNEKLPVYKQVHKVHIRHEDFVRTTTKKIKRHENV